MSSRKSLPRSSYTKRNKPMKNDLNKNRLSHSAMSSRTFSRVKSNQSSTNEDLQRSLGFSSADENIENVNGSNEEEYEEQLLSRLLEQQQQLRELQIRQQKLLSMQKNLGELNETAESAMSTKLDKLQTVCSRIDQLQGFVDGNENEENTIATHSAAPSEQQRIAQALTQLTELKTLVDNLSKGIENADFPSSPNSESSLKPIFSDHVSMTTTTPQRKHKKLPEVTVVKHTHDTNQGGVTNKAKSPRKSEKFKTTSGGISKPVLEVNGNSSELLREVQRHQMLLKEINEKRNELQNVMKEMDKIKQDTSKMNDTETSSGKFNLGGNGDYSVHDPCAFETSDSGRLFGLNESATKKLIDIIRAQKNLDANGMTEKTTATWGSSSHTSDSDDEESGTSEDEEFSRTHESTADNDTLALAHESMVNKYGNDHEIDFRPPTRRQISDDELSENFSTFEEWQETTELVQEDLSAAQLTMQLLLEDQQALQKLLQNSLNIRNNDFSSKVCYGISPDFLFYQLDNCYNQVLSLQDEMRSLQWRLYKVMGDPNKTPKGTKSAPQSHQRQRNKNLISMPRGNQSQPAGNNNSFSLSYYDKFARNNREIQNKNGKRNIPNIQRNQCQTSFDKIDDKCEKEFLQKSREDTKSQSDEIDGALDLFDSLRDSIYSEAAILISQNESRPHYLMELFHSLQQVNTDLLRQQCLYSIQDVLKGYISKKVETSSTVVHAGKNLKHPPRSMSYSENTPSESAVTSDDEIYAKLRAKVAKDNNYDYSLKISSGSELSTPSEDEQPFASEDLGSTVIHLDAALRHMREVERIKQEQESSGSSPQSLRNFMGGDATTQPFTMIDSKELNSTIKKVISDVIPVLKEDRENLVDIRFLANLQSTVIESLLKEVQKSDETKNKSKNTSLELFFTKQLQTILSQNMLKFVSKRVGSCGEELVLNMSEVLFNELAFYFMMQDMDKGERSTSSAKIVDINEVQIIGDENDLDDSNTDQIKPDKSENESKENMSPKNSQKNDAKKQIEVNSSIAVTFDLSVSETKPLTSYGSGEDEGEGSGDEYMYNEPDVPTSIQHDQHTVADSKTAENEKAETSGINSKVEATSQENA